MKKFKKLTISLALSMVMVMAGCATTITTQTDRITGEQWSYMPLDWASRTKLRCTTDHTLQIDVNDNKIFNIPNEVMRVEVRIDGQRMTAWGKMFNNSYDSYWLDGEVVFRAYGVNHSVEWYREQFGLG